jgi:hypothetical protein
MGRHLEGNSRLVVIKNAGHAVNLEKPKDVCRNIIDYFQRAGYRSSKRRKGMQTLGSTKSQNIRCFLDLLDPCTELNARMQNCWLVFSNSFFSVHVAGVAVHV